MVAFLIATIVMKWKTKENAEIFGFKRNIKILLFLGYNDEYLNHKIFNSETTLEKYIERIENLMLENCKKEKPLKDRLKLIDEKDYVLFIGKCVTFEVIDVD